MGTAEFSLQIVSVFAYQTKGEVELESKDTQVSVPWTPLKDNEEDQQMVKKPDQNH